MRPEHRPVACTRREVEARLQLVGSRQVRSPIQPRSLGMSEEQITDLAQYLKSL